jgi:hypothetical protein
MYSKQVHLESTYNVVNSRENIILIIKHTADIISFKIHVVRSETGKPVYTVYNSCEIKQNNRYYISCRKLGLKLRNKIENVRTTLKFDAFAQRLLPRKRNSTFPFYCCWGRCSCQKYKIVQLRHGKATVGPPYTVVELQIISKCC